MIPLINSASAEKAVLDAVPGGLLIGSQWRESSDGGCLTVYDPATGLPLRTIASATPRDGVDALDAAVAAQHEWAATPSRLRSEILRRAWELLQDRQDEFAMLITLEMGKPLDESRAEVAYGGEFLRWFSEEAVRVAGRYGPNPEGTGRIVVSHGPVGPCLLITPWNFPLAMATRKVAPALAAGCTVVLKPAELTPLTTLLLADLLLEAGVPGGVVNVIPTTSSHSVTAPLIADQRLRKLSFTGSTEVGRSLLKQAADTVLRASMELGGNAPFLVFEDADLDAAVDGAIAAKFRNSGEACTAANRFLVQRGVVKEFADRVAQRVAALKVGRGTEPGVRIGPLIDQAAVLKIGELVDDAVRGGATLHVGGHRLDRPGTFFAPSVLSDVSPRSRLAATEVFGPVLSTVTFDTEDEGVALANDTEFGLAGYVYTRDLARAHRMIDRLETGMLGINAGVISNAAAPFGGVKKSGLGREGGAEGINEYLDTKYTFISAF